MDEQKIITNASNIEHQNTASTVASGASIQSDNSKKSFALDKIGIIILVVTLVIGLALLIPGIVLASGGKSNNNSNDNSSGYTTVSINSTQYRNNAVEDACYYYKVTANNDGYLYVLLDNCELTSVQTSSGLALMASNNTNYNTSFDETYSFKAEYGTTYYLKIQASVSGTIKFKVSNYNF